MKKIKNVDDLRILYYLTVQTTASTNNIPYWPRWFNQLYANLYSYFWMPCHLCGRKFGGHEWICSKDGKGICPKCSLKQYNKTEQFHQWRKK